MTSPGDDADDEMTYCDDLDLIAGLAECCSKKETGQTIQQRRLTVKQYKKKKNDVVHTFSPKPLIQKRWRNALRKAQSIEDPWLEFHIETIKSETAKRYRYNAVKKEWVTDMVRVKMEATPFNKGAMRECFRMKKLSNFVKDDWAGAANYVGKRYMEDGVGRQIYFDDVTLQMDAKLWAAVYNQANPVKQVDIFQMSVLEFSEREGSPLYHLEHYIEGDYIKYNSNSGFVDDSVMRNTPHAFSHFTFEHSGHELIVVDIQGVGDLYTDPQIHTYDGVGYGDGNLGPRGMALFFFSHKCNRLCKAMGLTPFDLAASELEVRERLASSSSCSESGTMAVLRTGNPLPLLNTHLAGLVRSGSEDASADSGIPEDDHDFDNPRNSRFNSFGYSPHQSPSDLNFDKPTICPHGRSRYESVSSEGIVKDMDDAAFQAFHKGHIHRHRPSHFHIDSMLADETEESVLGKVHFELVRLHESGRFAENKNVELVDWEAALFHHEKAAELGCIEAMTNWAKICLGLPRDILIDCPVKAENVSVEEGLRYLGLAAKAGDRAAMIFLAKEADQGSLTGKPNWVQAVRWYDEAIKSALQDDAFDNELDGDGEKPSRSAGYDATADSPVYEMQARVAAMLVEGGHSLNKNPSRAAELYNEAAEAAMTDMKGRLASKYYELAEIACGEIEEE